MPVLSELLSQHISKSTIKIILSKPRKKLQDNKKMVIRALPTNAKHDFQAERFFEDTVAHKNLQFVEVINYISPFIQTDFVNITIINSKETVEIRAAKPDDPHASIQKTPTRVTPAQPSKNYLLKEGTPIPFLIEVGIMNPAGKVYAQKQKKFRQINRFLELFDDVYSSLPETPKEIIDFGCGKSSLTFAIYHYLHQIKKTKTHILGLDLKKDVIHRCQLIRDRLQYGHLSFQVGDISNHQATHADIVLSLHACDTATDYALINAVQWGAKAILSVPCCQHELFSAVSSPLHDPLLRHGIWKDRWVEILTDTLRSLALEANGYQVDVVEFASLEHTAKNVMIRARKTNISAKKRHHAANQFTALCNYWGVCPTIQKLVETL